MRCRFLILSLVSVLSLHTTVVAHPLSTSGPTPDLPVKGNEPSRDIIVSAQRALGSAIRDVEPVVVLDQASILSIGATSFKELAERLKPLTTSVDGSEPVYLLNGRRVSGLSEIDNLPPEAIERTEVLPESEAARFGFPPTVRVTNFIIKKRFRALAFSEVAGTTTEGGGGSQYLEANSTRIDGPRRLSVSLSHLHLGPLLQSQRDIAPDPGTLYSTSGTITGVGGQSIDPKLDALAGQSVIVALLPETAAERRLLSNYLAGANTSRLVGIGQFRSLQQRSDTVELSTTVATPIGRALDASFNLSLEAKESFGLNGVAPAVIRVPGGGGVLPFSSDVLLYRYVSDVVLRQRSQSLNQHAGGTLQGGVRRWAWNVTGSYDRYHSRGRSDQGLAPEALQTAVGLGDDPLPPTIDTAADKLTDRTDTLTGTLATKAVANGPLLRLPAGDAQMTVSTEYVRSSSSGEQSSLAGQPFDVQRSTKTASVSANLPIAAAERRVLPFLGRLAVNGSLGVSAISGYGRLVTSSYGGTWTPNRAVQLTATISDVLTPPEIALLVEPTLISPNTSFFDFTKGTSALVKVFTGGRPELLPERRRRTQLGLSLTPIKGKELRVSADYINTRLTNQTGTLGGATAFFQAAFPSAFVRDAAGQLVSADLRPVNIGSERERRVRMTLSFSTQIGRPPPPAPTASVAGAQSDVPSPRPSKPRPTVSAVITSTLRLSDEVMLQPGSPLLDLLNGGTLTGTGGRPKWETQIDLRGSSGALGFGVFGRLQGTTRIRSDFAQSDLSFSGRIWLVPYVSLDVSKLVGRPWASKLLLQLVSENVLNDRINVRDRTGATPNRFQSAYIDPLGRSIRLGVRKLF